MTENSKKGKTLTTAIAVILAVLIAIGGSTFAYLQAETDDVVNEFAANQVTVDLKESTDGKYNIIPGTSEFKDPTVTVNTTVPAYVYVEVTDNTENLVTYAIADGWTQLEGYPNVYYRELDSAADNEKFEVLKNNTVSYDDAIVNSDMLIQNDDGTYSLKDGITLSFKALAIQKEGFSDEVEAYKYLVSGEKPILSGYTSLYEYDLSATSDDDVKAYYMVPNKNTSPIEIQTKKARAKAAAADANTIIEYNGVRYELSDEDTFIITGEGEMKPEIQREIVDYDGYQKAVAEHFGFYLKNDDSIFKYKEYCNDSNESFEWQFNNIYASNTSIHLEKPVSTQLLNEINAYIDEILPNYAITLPKTVIIKTGVNTVSNSAFFGCDSLENVIIEDGVTKINSQAFRDCRNLTNISLPDSISTIGSSAFSGCSSLKTVTIPSGVTNSGGNIFNNCTNLTDVIIADGVTMIGGGDFYQCYNLENIEIPDSVTNIGIGAFYRCSKLTDITIPNGVTSIKDMTFEYCTNLTTVTLPGSVTSIGEKAFESCKNLTNITIPDNVTSIGKEAFKGCESLTDITIPDGVVSVEDGTFNGCKNLNKISIPNKVKKIGNNAFNSCTSITDISVPNSVTEIGAYAFNGCTSLTNVLIPNSVKKISGNGPFTKIANNSTIYCQSQAVANLLTINSYTSANTSVVVDASKF